MPTRTNSINVKAVLGTEYDTVNSPDLTPFIQTASAIVDQIVLLDVASLLGSSLQEIVERWLSAHFYQIMDPGYKSRSTGGASGSLNGETGQTFKCTRYGQQACALDLTGWLARRDKEVEEGSRRKVQLLWVGDDNSPNAYGG